MGRSKQPNTALAVVVNDSGLSATEIARRLNDVAASVGLERASFDHTSVARWLRGEHPRPRTVELLAVVLSEAAGRSITPADVGMGGATVRTDAGLVFDQSLEGSLATIADLIGGDIRSQRFLSAAAFLPSAFTTPVLRWITAPPARTPHSLVGIGEARAVRKVARTFRDLDNKFGGGYARSTVVHYLHSEVVPLLRSARWREATGQELFSASAELMLLVGWMSFDTAQHSLAQRYLIQALRLAQEAGDTKLGAEVLNAMSCVTARLGHPAEAVDLARAARRSAIEASLPTLVSESLALEAHGHALGDDSASCAASLLGAEQALDRANLVDSPEWLRYFDTRYLAAKASRALLDAGDARSAAAAAAYSLQMRGGYARGRAFNLTLLAHANAALGEVEQACHIGSMALNAGRTMHSARTRADLAALVNALKPYESKAAVRGLMRTISASVNAGPAVPALPADRSPTQTLGSSAQ
ncbi:hypothetical protein [Catenulispora pinisilvae]|uniref:hypothetical protein n=1 Tax=Catenulispora pinisilvae TaxID=2705253 RepID=UPI001891D01A|nr:hypothetical protein [Catenulispora pinisilvae]